MKHHPIAQGTERDWLDLHKIQLKMKEKQGLYLLICVDSAAGAQLLKAARALRSSGQAALGFGKGF